MTLEQNRARSESSVSPLFFPLLQAVLVLLLLRNFLWQEERILSLGGEGDIFIQFYMMRDFAVTHLLNGEFPFWNPHIFGGIPFFGGMQSAMLYPPNVIYLMLPLPLAINWSIALHLWLMGLFTTRWLQYGLRLSPFAAGIGGLMTMFGGPFFMHIHGGHLSNLSVMIWAPLIFIALQRWFDGGTQRWLALGAVAVTMQILGGHPQYLYYTGITALLLSSWHLITRSQHRGRDLLGFVLIYLIGLLLGAVQLLPGLEAASENVRAGGTSSEFVGMLSLPPAHLLSLFSPHLFDQDLDRAVLWESSLYIGIAGLFLAATGLHHHDTRRARAYFIMMLLVMVLALGHFTPLFSALYHLLPGFDLFRGTTRFTFFALLLGSALTAMGMEQLLRSPEQFSKRYTTPLTLLTVSLAVALIAMHLLSRWPAPAPLLPSLPRFATITHDLAIDLVWLTLIVLVVWRGHRVLRNPALLLGTLLLVELFVNAANHLPWFKEAELRRHPLVEALHSIDKEERVLNLNLRNASMLTGHSDIWGSDPGLSKRWAEFIAHTQGFETPENQDILFSGNTPQLAIARLGWHFDPTPEGVTVTPADSGPLPHAQLFYSVEALAKERLLARLGDTAFDFRQTLLVEKPFEFQSSSNGKGHVNVVSTTINSLDLEIASSTPALLLITDSYSPGWRAFEHGTRRELPIVPVDHAFIGIPIESGHHKLHLIYRPRTLTIGIIFSVTGLLGLLLLFRRSHSPLRAKMATLSLEQ